MLNNCSKTILGSGHSKAKSAEGMNSLPVDIDVTLTFLALANAEISRKTFTWSFSMDKLKYVLEKRTKEE